MRDKKKPKVKRLNRHERHMLAFNGLADDMVKQRTRADAWKAIAGRLAKAARCTCCDSGGLGCDDCCESLEA